MAIPEKLRKKLEEELERVTAEEMELVLRALKQEQKRRKSKRKQSKK